MYCEGLFFSSVVLLLSYLSESLLYCLWSRAWNVLTICYLLICEPVVGIEQCNAPAHSTLSWPVRYISSPVDAIWTIFSILRSAVLLTFGRTLPAHIWGSRWCPCLRTCIELQHSATQDKPYYHKSNNLHEDERHEA